jgi:transcription elongation factor GreA
MLKDKKIMKKTIQITKEGKQELEKEIADLKGRRKEIAERIATARDFGDLSENAEYDAAREEQGLVESRIAEIEDILLNAQVIKNSRKNEIEVGSLVELSDGSNTYNYTIVGPVEADPLAGKISNVSPLGTALKGKKVGETAVISTPKGETKYKVVRIR